MRLADATGKTWYKVLYQHTMYVKSLSNISIKTNNKGRIKINKFVQYSMGDYMFCTWRHIICYRSFINITLQSESRLDNGVFSINLSHTFLYRNRTRFRIHRPSVENSLVLIVASVKYNRGSEKNIENCFFHINLRPGAWTSCNKGVLQKLKRHGNGGSCLKKHEKLKIKIFAERVMESHI